MYSTVVTKISTSGNNAVLITFLKDDTQQIITRQEFISALSDDKFLELFKEVLCKNMEGEIVWEVTPFARSKLDEPLEMIIIRAEALDNRPVDNDAFKEYRTNKNSVTSFPSLRKDATMIIPVEPVNEKNLASYHSFYSWLMYCSLSQFQQLFHLVHEELVASLNRHDTVWLSTSGFGVAWLHVRIDTVPKYFQYGPYKSSSSKPSSSKQNQNCNPS